jgi:hypothetical protein
MKREEVLMESKNWREGLTHKDWLFDGRPIRGEYLIDRFSHLDWSRARVELGPSIAGNLGPYWHVPMDDGDTVHRLYPKVLLSKWLLVIRRACEELRHPDRDGQDYVCERVF